MKAGQIVGVREKAKSLEVIEAALAGFNHSKLLVCDDSLCTCGSTNVDFRSFENNFEANVFFYDKEMALKMKEVFLTDEAECIVLDSPDIFAHRPFLARLWESLIRLLSPLL